MGPWVWAEGPGETAIEVPSRHLSPGGNSHLTEALAGESSGLSHPFLSQPPMVAPGNLGCAGPGPQLPRGDARRVSLGTQVLLEYCPKDKSLAGGPEPAPPARAGRQERPLLLPGAVAGQQESRSTPSPFFLLLPQPWTLPIHVASPRKGHLENTRQSTI